MHQQPDGTAEPNIKTEDIFGSVNFIIEFDYIYSNYFPHFTHVKEEKNEKIVHSKMSLHLDYFFIIIFLLLFINIIHK